MKTDNRPERNIFMSVQQDQKTIRKMHLNYWELLVMRLGKSLKYHSDRIRLRYTEMSVQYTFLFDKSVASNVAVGHL